MRRWAIPCVVAAVAGLWFTTRDEPAPRRPRPGRTSVALPDEEAGAALGEALVHSRALPDADDARAALKRAVAAVGPPAEADRAAWVPYADVVEALDRVVARPGLSLPPALQDEAVVQLSYGARAMLVRAWERARTEGPEAGVADMLAVLVLGNRLTDAAEEGLPVAVSVGMRGMALRELVQLVDRWPEVGVFESVRVGLLATPPPRGAMARVLEASCVREMDALSTELAKPGKVLAHLNLEEPVAALGVAPTVANTVVRAVMYERTPRWTGGASAILWAGACPPSAPGSSRWRPAKTGRGPCRRCSRPQWPRGSIGPKPGRPRRRWPRSCRAGCPRCWRTPSGRGASGSWAKSSCRLPR